MIIKYNSYHSYYTFRLKSKITPFFILLLFSFIHMDIIAFKAGKQLKGYNYQYFMPEYINHAFIWQDAELNELLEQAALKAGELNAFAQQVPDAAMFIKMHVFKEAVVSSRIEGTQTHMEEALLNKKDIRPERKDDWQEVNNYVQAMDHALKELNKLPLSNRLFRQLHVILMKSVRGEKKTPGEFRISQNWIGGASLADAVFVPPAHACSRPDGRSGKIHP